MVFFICSVVPWPAVPWSVIDDHAKDGGEELFTEMHCVRSRQFLTNLQEFNLVPRVLLRHTLITKPNEVEQRTHSGDEIDKNSIIV